MVEGVPRLVGGQGEVVEAAGRLPPHGHGPPLVQLQPHRPRHVTLGGEDVGIQVLAVAAEPEAVVDQLGILLGHPRLEAALVAGEGHLLQGLVGHEQRHRRRRLVDLPRLDAHQPVLQHVYAPHAVLAGQGVQGRDQLHRPHLAAVQGHRHPLLEGHLHIGGGVGRAVEGPRPLEGVLGRLLPGVLQGPALHRASPQVHVHRVGAGLGDRHGDAVALGVFDLPLPVHVPLPHRRHDAQVGRQGLHRHVEAHLVVALAGAAVGHGRGPLLPGHLHQQPGNEGARKGRGQRVVPLVDGPGTEGAEGVFAQEGLASVTPDELPGTGGQGAGLERLAVAVHAHVHRQGDDVVAPLLLQPADGHRGVQSARVGQHHLLAHGSSLHAGLDAPDDPVQGVHRPVQLLAGDGQGRHQAQGIGTDVVHQQALLQGQGHRLFGGVMSELHRPEEAQPPHLPHQGMAVGQGQEAPAQVAPQLGGPPGQVFIEDVAEHPLGDAAGQGVAAEGGAVVAGHEGGGPFAGQQRTDGEATAQPLGQGHHVGRGLV